MPPSEATVAYWLGYEIDDLTNGEYSAELLEGVIIANALPLIRQLADKVRIRKDTVVGILIDLADKGVPLAGATLLDAIKKDPELQNIPVVVYTSRFMDFKKADLLEGGAVAVVKRKATGGKAGDVGKQVLDAFKISYDDGTNSTGPKKVV